MEGNNCRFQSLFTRIRPSAHSNLWKVDIERIAMQGVKVKIVKSHLSALRHSEYNAVLTVLVVRQT